MAIRARKDAPEGLQRGTSFGNDLAYNSFARHIPMCNAGPHRQIEWLYSITTESVYAL